MSGQLIIIKGYKAFDVSTLVNTVKWNGRKGAAARSLSVTFLDDDGFGHDRTGIDVEQGHWCIYYREGRELFRGMFMRQAQSSKKIMPVVAYDNGIYLANNSDTFTYTNAKANTIFTDVCKRFGVPFDSGHIADTSYNIPELCKPKTTGWDVICDALSLTFKAKGIRYYPRCFGENMRLLERRMNILQWVVETGVNLQDYTLNKSIENVRTRIKLLSKEGAVLAQAVDKNLEQRIGAFQHVESGDDEMNSAQLNELVNSIRNEKNKPERSLTLTATGLPEVYSGMGVYIIIKELGISKSYYVEEDTHTFQGHHHSMSLKLCHATDVKY